MKTKAPDNISIYSLAEELNIHPSTVSRALNNSEQVGKATRDKVLSLAGKYGFELRPFTSRTKNICALIVTQRENEDFFSNYVTSVLRGITQYASQHSIETSLFSAHVAKLNKININRKLRSQNVDGAVIINMVDDCSFLPKMEEAGFTQYCAVNYDSAQVPFHKALVTDNRPVAKEAIQHLISLRHRHIAFIQSEPHSMISQQRLTGYKTALRDAGLQINADLVLSPLDPKASGTQFGINVMKRILKEHPQITALFSMGGSITNGLLYALHQQHLQVPDDFSLISCDDSNWMKYGRPPVSVMDLPNQELGYYSAKWVHQMIESPTDTIPPPKTKLSGRLILRETTAPPRMSTIKTKK